MLAILAIDKEIELEFSTRGLPSNIYYKPIVDIIKLGLQENLLLSI